jgi:hypothetical protein
MTGPSISTRQPGPRDAATRAARAMSACATRAGRRVMRACPPLPGAVGRRSQRAVKRSEASAQIKDGGAPCLGVVQPVAKRAKPPHPHAAYDRLLRQGGESDDDDDVVCRAPARSRLRNNFAKWRCAPVPPFLYRCDGHHGVDSKMRQLQGEEPLIDVLTAIGNRFAFAGAFGR